MNILEYQKKNAQMILSNFEKKIFWKSETPKFWLFECSDMLKGGLLKSFFEGHLSEKIEDPNSDLPLFSWN